jgi:hypothetical protein
MPDTSLRHPREPRPADLGTALRACALALVLAVASTTSAAAQRAESYPQLELGMLGGGTFPLDSEERLDDVGPAIGALALVRIGEPLALGIALEHVMLGWDAAGPAGFAFEGSLFPDDDGRVTHTLIVALARWYVLGAGAHQPYAQIGIGSGALTYAPEHPDCSEADGVTPQLAVGLDFSLASWLRAGASMSAHPSAWGLGCDDIGYEGKPPDAPYPGLLLGARVGLTSVWDAR